MPRPDLIPSRGAVAEPLTLEVTREITAHDMMRIGEAPKTGVPMLQKLRSTHHKMAMLLAQGKSNGEIAVIVGCTAQRIVQLQGDPTFTELVAYYHDQTMSAMLSDAARLQDKIVDVGEMAVDELRERLENDAQRKAMRTGDIRQIAEFAMDRTVAPPKAAQNAQQPPAQVTINFGTPIRDDSKSLPDGKTIEGEIEKE